MGDGAVITIDLANTIQSRGGVHEILLAAAPGSLFCPVRALERLYALRGTPPAPSDYALVFPDNTGSFSPLVKRRFLKWFRMRLEQMGLDGSKFHIHGFRLGLVQLALLSGNDITFAKLHSDNLADAVMSYAHADPVERGVITKSMIATLDRQLVV